MKFTDRILQRWRIAQAGRFIAPGSQILDIGSADGALFRQLGVRKRCLGIDPTLKSNICVDDVTMVAGFFPKDMPAVEPFDVITMLAVLEHFPSSAYESLQAGCTQFLRPGGRLIITVPAAAVDQILAVLSFLRLIDGMALEEHHGYQVEQTTAVFPPKTFRLLCRKKFQLGLNNLFVFERVSPQKT